MDFPFKSWEEIPVGIYAIAHNEAKFVPRWLESMKEADKIYVYENNNSSDGTPDIVEEKFPEAVLIRNKKNRGFGYGHNSVLKEVTSDVHFVINPDIYLKENTIKILADYLKENKGTGLVTPRVLNTDGTEQFLPKRPPSIRHVILSKLPGLKRYRREYTRQEDCFDAPSSVEFCTGCFFAAPTKLLKKLKGFSEMYYMYFEDADLSKKVLGCGYKIVFDTETEVYHDWNRENTGNILGIKRFLTSMFKYFMRWGWKF